MRKFISIILAALILLLSCATISFADEFTLTPAQKSAAALQSLNLFAGTDNGFELEREPLRIECIVTIIRLLGEEKAALACTDEHPFTDIPDWADPYAAYAYTNGITKGISQTEFGYNVKADKKQFATLLLRAISYSEANGDFTYDTADEAGKAYKIIDETVNSDKFLRGDMVIMSYLALSVNIKGTDIPLADSLMTAQVFTKEAYDKANAIMNTVEQDKPVSGNSSSSGSSSGGSSSSGSSSGGLTGGLTGGTTGDFSGEIDLGTPDANVNEQRAELPKLHATVKNYYSELSKVILLVDSPALEAEYSEISERLAKINVALAMNLSDSEVIEYYKELKALFDDMEMLAITIAIER